MSEGPRGGLVAGAGGRSAGAYAGTRALTGTSNREGSRPSSSYFEGFSSTRTRRVPPGPRSPRSSMMSAGSTRPARSTPTSLPTRILESGFFFLGRGMAARKLEPGSDRSRPKRARMLEVVDAVKR